MAMYLGTQKITPALIEEKPYLKLGKPKVLLNYEKDTLQVVPNPYTFHLAPGLTELYINDVKDSTFQIGNSIIIDSDRLPPSCRLQQTQTIKDLNSFSIGVYNFKAQTSLDAQHGVISYDTSSFGSFEAPIQKSNLKNSDFSDEVIYEKWSYTNSLTDLSTNSITGVLNNSKYDEGIITTYKKTINYKYDLNPSKNGSLNYDDSFVSLVAQMKDDSLICNGYYYSSSFAKISFTLTEDIEVKVKYQITQSTDKTPTILITPIDKSFSSFGYSSKLSDPVVSFSTTTDFAEKEYSFGTLSAGEHFYFVQFFNYGSDFRKRWNAIVTPYFEKIELGKNLPANITVTYNRNYENHPDTEEKPVADYEYDPYTGKFKIPIVGNITMTAVGSSNVVLNRLMITPTTWDVGTSTLTWEYSINNATYHIQTPGGNEYTTTEKSFDFTGKLGAASSDFEDYKLVKIWATTSNNQSGITKLKLIYNPGFEENHIEKIRQFDIENLKTTFSTVYIYNDYKYLFASKGGNVKVIDENKNIVYQATLDGTTNSSFCGRILKEENGILYLLYYTSTNFAIIKFNLSDFSDGVFCSQSITTSLDEKLIVDLTDTYFIYKLTNDNYLYRVNLESKETEKSLAVITGMTYFKNHELKCTYKDTEGFVVFRIYYGDLNTLWSTVGSPSSKSVYTVINEDYTFWDFDIRDEIIGNKTYNKAYGIYNNYSDAHIYKFEINDHSTPDDYFLKSTILTGFNYRSDAQYNSTRINDYEYLVAGENWMRVNTKYNTVRSMDVFLSGYSNFPGPIYPSNIYNGKVILPLPIINYMYELLL